MKAATTINPPKPLSVKEKKRLAELEEILACTVQAFMDHIMALKEVHDLRLYRIKGPSFHEYCAKTWNISGRRGEQLVAAGRVIENLNANSCSYPMLPFNESMIRPLTSLEPAQQVRIWQEAVSTAPDGRVTANHVANTVTRLYNTKISKKIKEKRRHLGNSVFINPEFEKAFDNFLTQIEREADNNWQTTSRQMVVKHLKAALAAVEAD